MRGCLFIREFLLAERLWLKSDFRYNFILSRIRIECWQVVVFRQSSLAGEAGNKCAVNELGGW